MVALACIAALLMGCGGALAPRAGTPTPARHILFIGNSYTFMNGGIDQQLKGLAPSSEISSVAIGGYTLENHWNDPNTLQTIRKGGWDFVVLQEQSQTPIFDRDRYYQYARLLDTEIRKTGARTVLLMTWQRPAD